MEEREYVYAIRQTQESENYYGYVYEVYEDYDMALKECMRLNKVYGNKEEIGTDLAHFYELDSIEIIRNK